MYQIVRTSQFKRDIKKSLRRNSNMDKFKRLIVLLTGTDELPEKYKDHPLKGEYKDCRDCHIEPDWILIYRKSGKDLELIRTGSHSDLF